MRASTSLPSTFSTYCAAQPHRPSLPNFQQGRCPVLPVARGCSWLTHGHHAPQPPPRPSGCQAEPPLAPSPSAAVHPTALTLSPLTASPWPSSIAGQCRTPADHASLSCRTAPPVLTLSFVRPDLPRASPPAPYTCLTAAAELTDEALGISPPCSAPCTALICSRALPPRLRGPARR